MLASASCPGSVCWPCGRRTSSRIFPGGSRRSTDVLMWYQLPTAIRSEAWRGGQAKGKQRPSAVWERSLTSWGPAQRMWWCRRSWFLWRQRAELDDLGRDDIRERDAVPNTIFLNRVADATAPSPWAWSLLVDGLVDFAPILSAVVAT
jgi:hypothetical protein